jgi:hypothetical protein
MAAVRLFSAFWKYTCIISFLDACIRRRGRRGRGRRRSVIFSARRQPLCLIFLHYSHGLPFLRNMLNIDDDLILLPGEVVPSSDSEEPFDICVLVIPQFMVTTVLDMHQEWILNNIPQSN